jgi:uncharacterized protein (TIGR02757 family)
MLPTHDELRILLESVYADCHRPELIDPDPVLVVREYQDDLDREIAALFCAMFALGRAGAIVTACRKALRPFGPQLRESLLNLDARGTELLLEGFVYRFFVAADAAALLRASALLSCEYGSLEGLFLAGGDKSPLTSKTHYQGPAVRTLSRCDAFIDRIHTESVAQLALMQARNSTTPAPRALSPNLLSAPRDGSACKRLMLFLRWMVRRDCIDPGLWTGVSPRELIVPLDTHMHRTARTLGLGTRTTADLRAALETTESLREFDPEDPVRFDFSLVRLGIRSDYHLSQYYCP